MAFQDDLYSLSGDPTGSGKYEIELALGDLLNSILPLVDKLRARRSLSWDERLRFGQFLGIQFSRTPMFFKNSSSIFDAWHSALAEAIAARISPRISREAIVAELRGATALTKNGVIISDAGDFEKQSALLAGLALGEELASRVWLIRRSRRSAFITSDNPLIQIRAGAPPLTPEYGPRTPNSVSLMAMSADTAIIVAPEVGQAIGFGDASDAEVGYINAHIAVNCDSLLLGLTKSDLEEAVTHSQLRKRGRGAFQVFHERVAKDARALVDNALASFE